MRWTLIIRREPMDVRYERVPQHLLMGLIQGHVIEGRVHGVEAMPEIEEAAPAPRGLPLAA